VQKKHNIPLADILFLFGLGFLPLDSAPFFPVGTQNRPIAFVFFLSFLFIHLTFRQKLSRAGVKFTLAFLGISVYNLIVYFTNGFYEFPEVLVKTAVVTPVAFVMGLAAIEFFHKNAVRGNMENLLNQIARAFLISFVIILPVIVIQGLARLELLDSNFVTTVTSRFSYRSVPDRIQGVSGETAQSLRYLFLFAIFFLYGLKKGIGRCIALLILVITALSGSVFGIAFLFVVVLVHFSIFIFPRFDFRKFAELIVFTFVVLALGQMLFLEFANEYTLNKVRLLSGILSNVENFGFELASAGDGSTFLRLMNPVIGWYIFIDSNYTGVGAHAYHIPYIAIVSEYYPYALNFDAINSVAIGESYMTAKSMVAKVLAEFGVIGATLTLFLFYTSYKSLSRYNVLFPKHERFNKLLFSFFVALFCFTESYIYFPFYMLFAYFLVYLPTNESVSRSSRV